MDSLGPRPLRHICMPGSHDAGMSVIGTKTGASDWQNTQTQEWSIGQQLEAGACYFDIRPVISGGEFFTGHYGPIGATWQGANGQSMGEVIDQINAFAQTNGELIILDLTHGLDTDNGYATLAEDQCGDLYDLINDNLSNLFTNPNGADYLVNITMDEYIGDGSPCVLIISEDVSADNYEFVFTHEKFGGIFNEYAETDDGNDMASDQLAKLAANRTISETSGGEFFVLSWTLTQQSDNLLTPILDLASQVNENIWTTAYPAFTMESFPSVLMVDAYGTTVYLEGGEDGGSGHPPKEKKLRKRSFFPPGYDTPANDLAALAIAVNAMAGANPIISGEVNG